jgi:2-polyprenyl-3-methyl-5-hydroxy-6-metoxy-1,4-benzoquinol methylase
MSKRLNKDRRPLITDHRSLSNDHQRFVIFEPLSSIHYPLSSISSPPSTLLSPRQRWDERYAVFSPEDRREPTPFVVACLPQLPQQGKALDVAAGAGRHSLALAQHGLQVDAVDISCQGLRLAQQRAKAAGVSIRFIVADIERPWLPQRRYEVILVSFFLYRSLFPLIKERLQPGGWLIYETLTTAQQIGCGDQPIQRGFLLEPDELRAAFADFEILFYAEADHGDRTTAQLLARKPYEF